MPAICSRVSDSGHAVLVRLPGGARFVGRYADDGSVRDLTPFAANLLLAGALDTAEQLEAERPEPQEQVSAVEVSYLTAPHEPGPGRIRPKAGIRRSR